MARKTVVLAYFNDESTADDAVESFKKWDKADDDIKLDAIGVLVLDDNGKIKTHKLGKRSVGKGAGIGLVLAVIAPPTLIAGVVGGAVMGAFHTRASASTPRTATGSRRSSPQVRPRSACSSVDIDRVSGKLASSAGKPRARGGRRGRRRGRGAAPAVEDAEAAAGDDLSIIDGIGPRYADALKRTVSRRSPRSPG